MTRHTIVTLTILLLPTLSAAQEKPDFLKKYESEGLPPVPVLERLDPKRGNPVPANAQVSLEAVKVVAQPETPQELSAIESAARIAASSAAIAAIAPANVRLVGGGVLPPALDSAPAEAAQYLFTFYDYGKERAVEVRVSNGAVLNVREREPGYQPPASAEEIADATKTAKEDRFPSDVDPNSIRALAFAGADGRRQIYLFGENSSRFVSATVVPAKRQVLKFDSRSKQ